MGGQRIGASGKAASCRDQKNLRSHHGRQQAGGDADAAAFVASIIVVEIVCGTVPGVTGAVGMVPPDVATVTGPGSHVIVTVILRRVRVSDWR